MEPGQKKPLISVIIPVYNVERYIGRCLDSILAQTFTDFEVVVVVDCSPDSSAMIAREYAAQDYRIKVLEKPVNEGTMEARRTGYENAAGEFIVFCDGDDVLPADALHRMWAFASRDNDMAFFGLRIINPDGTVKLMPRLRVQVNSREDIYLALLKQQMTWYLCAAMYRRSLFVSGKLETFVGQCVNEDYMLILQLLQQSDRVAFCNEYVYDYHLQPSSSSQGPQTLQKLYQELRANQWSCDYLCSRGIHPDKAKWLYFRRLVKCLHRGFSRRQILDSGLVERKLFTAGNIHRYAGFRYVVKYYWWNAVRSTKPSSHLSS